MSKEFYTSMQLDEVDFDHHQQWIALARDGSVEAAKALMGDAATCLEHGINLPEPLRSYIGIALWESIIPKKDGGKDISKAFNIKKGRGKNSYFEVFRKHLFCLEVQAAYYKYQRYVSSRNGPGAYEVVAIMYGYDTDHIRSVFEKNNKNWSIKQMENAEIDRQIIGYREVLKMFPTEKIP